MATALKASLGLTTAEMDARTLWGTNERIEALRILYMAGYDYGQRVDFLRSHFGISIEIAFSLVQELSPAMTVRR